ncbi:MAG: N-acetylmuramoyl-L-alanine amidase [bacterium]|nr:N-acetylmuramoyl-L-alanine amidase [bacterium]
MPDDPRQNGDRKYGDDEDAAFRQWLRSRPPEDEPVSASVTFMELMRQAAAKSSDDSAPVTDDPPATVPPEPPSAPARTGGAARRRTAPPLTSADISAAVRAAGGDFGRAADLNPTDGGQSPHPDHVVQRVRTDAAPRPIPERETAFVDAPAPEDEGALHDDPALAVEAADDDNDPSAAVDSAEAADADMTMRETAEIAKMRDEMRQRLIEERRARAARRQKPATALGGFLRTFILVFAAAGLMATIFTWWTPPRFINETVSEQLSMAMETDTRANAAAPLTPEAPIPTPNWALRIGVVSGHRGNDSGAVCPDGLTEAEINFNVATIVVRELRAIGYTVDLLDEFDPRLNNYQAVALVSIHANSCMDYGYEASGFLIAAAAARVTSRSVDDLLVECIARSYQSASGLERLPGVTIDMTDYHAFREIHPQTPAAILELGFMRADRDLLTGSAEQLAQGIKEGVLCFVEPARSVLEPTAQPAPTAISSPAETTPESGS